MGLYLMFLIPPMLLSLWASWKTKSAFGKYSKVPTANGLTGAQAAKRLGMTARSLRYRLSKFGLS